MRRVTFNAAGFTTSDTAAYGTPHAQTIQITRDPTTNLPTAYVDALNRRTELGYDAYGNLTSITELAGTDQARTFTVAYDGPFDQVSRVTDPLGHQTTYTYRADGALQAITDPVGRVTTFDSNEAGQVTSVTDNGGNKSSFTYALGDLAAVADPLDHVTRWFTDGLGRPVRVTDPLGNTTFVTYDGFSNVTSVTDPLGRVTEYTYDPNGNLIEVTDPRGNATTFEYDSSDQLVAMTDPLDRTHTYTYDGNGNLTSATSAGGDRTTYTYDELDRLTLVRFGVSGDSAESEISYTHDAGNRLTSIADSAAGTITITVDGLDRVTRMVTPEGQIDYGYDAADRRTSMTVAGQSPVTYDYNDADQIIGLSRGTQTVTFAYDPVGRRSSVTLPGGIEQVYEYDAAGQLTGIQYLRGGTAVGDLAYEYDAAGQPVRVTGSFARVAVPEPFGPVSYDAADQRTDHTYDADGRLTFDGTTTYTWNTRGHLTGLSRPGLSVSFGYDGLGRRVQRATGADTTGYLYDGWNPVRELTPGSPVDLLTGSLGEIFTRTTTQGTSALLTDALGSTVALADASGSLTADYTYEPFGAVTVTGDDAGNPYRYTGQPDDGTGLYYYRTRYYSPGQHRFISPDPLGLASGDTNPYRYVFNHPTAFIDPMGTKPQGSRDCFSNSFTADTPVLMADGATKPIQQVEVGDYVLATDPRTGQTIPAPVTATIEGTGTKTLVDLGVDTDGDGQADATLTATDKHPIWAADPTDVASSGELTSVEAAPVAPLDPASDVDGSGSGGGGPPPDVDVPLPGKWVDAVDLQAGQLLRTGAGTWVRVSSVETRTEPAEVHNLTVADLHTYHVVLAGRVSVLVHNDQGCGPEIAAAAIEGLPSKVTSGRILDSSGRDIWRALSSGSDRLTGPINDFLMRSPHAKYPPAGPHPAATHVETKYAWFMRQNGIMEADVVINNVRGVCTGIYSCSIAVPAILPKGAVMRVWYPGATQPTILRGLA